MTGTSEHGSKRSDSLTGGEHLELLSHYYFLNEDSAPWSKLMTLKVYSLWKS